jgi:hypothetical protein
VNGDTPNLIKGIIGSLVRYALGGFTLWLAQHGLLTETQAGALLEALIVVVITVTWAVWRKYKVQQRIATALALPAGSSPERLDREVKMKESA